MVIRTIKVNCNSTLSSAAGGLDLTLTVHRSRRDDETFGLFRGLVFKGEEVDPAYYTAEKGSVVLTLKSEFFKDLADGAYDLAALFDDGSVTVAVTVTQKVASPITGEAAPITAFAALALLSLALFAAASARRKKENS